MNLPGKVRRVLKGQTLERFLDDDGKVLTFVGLWDDTGRPGGDIRRLKIRFYVADHTMEVGEMLSGNSGRDMTSRFRVVRQRMKKPIDVSKPVSEGVNFGQTKNVEYFFQPHDLIVGSTVPIFGRPVFIHSCNSVTRNYFREALGIEQPRNTNQNVRSENDVAVTKKKAKGAIQQGFQFMEPQDKVARLETAIREKLEVASTFGTLNDQRTTSSSHVSCI